MSEPIANLVIEPRQTCQAAVFFLHGLGADQRDLLALADQLPVCAHMRALFVQAPDTAVSINERVVMPAWFDVEANDMNLLGLMNDEAGLHSSVARMAQYIQEQCRSGIAPERIALVGFSQGGAIALACALACRERLGAAASLSGWLVRNPLPRFSAKGAGVEAAESIEPLPAGDSHTPLLIHHGQDDEVVPYQSSAIAIARLEALGHDPGSASFACGHGITTEQLPLLDRFLKASLGIEANAL